MSSSFTDTVNNYFNCTYSYSHKQFYTFFTFLENTPCPSKYRMFLLIIIQLFFTATVNYNFQCTHSYFHKILTISSFYTCLLTILVLSRTNFSIIKVVPVVMDLFTYRTSSPVSALLHVNYKHV